MVNAEADTSFNINDSCGMGIRQEQSRGSYTRYDCECAENDYGLITQAFCISFLFNCTGYSLHMFTNRKGVRI